MQQYDKASRIKEKSLGNYQQHTLSTILTIILILVHNENNNAFQEISNRFLLASKRFPT
jgi:hypothetical protein